MVKNTALISGGNGIVGRNLAAYLASKGDWNIIVTSYSELGYEGDFEFVKLDLANPSSVRGQQNKLKDVTHVFFGAYVEQHTLAEQTRVNLNLLENLITGIADVAPGLKHVTFIQGGKAYGAHLGKYKTPAKETDARHFPPNFYYEQEDFLRRYSEGKSWSWTAIRPDIIIGLAIGNPMNLGTLIAVYASLCKELNVPMRFPGSERAYDVLVNVTDAGLLARGMEYVAINESAHGEIFNLTNGDVFRWKEIWPKIGAYFGVAVEEPQTFSLATYMSDKDELWKQMTVNYKLGENELSKLVKWSFGDFIFQNEHDAFFDVSKLRRSGFQEMNLDTFESFKALFDELRENHIIPA